MRKICLLGLILFGTTTFCYSQSNYYIAPWAQKFFLGLNALYDYEKFPSSKTSAYEKFSSSETPAIESNNLIFEIALGYDFGRVVPRIFFDIGLPLFGEVSFTKGNESLNGVMDTSNFKFGLEAGIKPLITERFDLVIPLGALFCWTTYTQKDPIYIEGHPVEKIWDYSYINLFSGIDAIFQLNRNFKIGLFSRIGIPVGTELEYKETLRGNYVWTATGDSTKSVKVGVDVLTFSIGVGVLANL